MKAIIIGNSGSGKTWLATRLARITAAPVVHLDDFFWEPGSFTKNRSNEGVKALIDASKEKTAWIVEGVFGDLAIQYLDVADLFIWLDVIWPICKDRLEKRSAESKLQLGREQSEEGLKNLLEWASHYYDRKDLCSRVGHRQLLIKWPGRKAQLRSEREVDRFLESIQKEVEENRE